MKYKNTWAEAVQCSCWCKTLCTQNRTDYHEKCTNFMWWKFCLFQLSKDAMITQE